MEWQVSLVLYMSQGAPKTLNTVHLGWTKFIFIFSIKQFEVQKEKKKEGRKEKAPNQMIGSTRI